MSELIQWPRAKYWTSQWNPVIGCKPCSPACEHCYAAAWAKRFNQSFEPHASKRASPPRKGICFCGNVTDLFGEWTNGPWHYIYSTNSRVIQGSSTATYLYLTKRVNRMVDALQSFGRTPNHYFGFTAENQEWFAKRAEMVVKQFPQWANLWVSMEPLIGEIKAPIMGLSPKPSWFVVGCESGPNRRPCKIEWVESIVEQCRAANIPVFVKQICLPNGKFTNKIEEFPKHLQTRQVPWAETNNED